MRAGIACLLLGAAVIHLLEASDHFTEDPAYGWFFVVAAASQALGAAAIAVLPKPAVVSAIVWVNVAFIALWLLSRTVGVPVGVTAGVRQTVRLPDLAATLLEIGSVASALFLMSSAGSGVSIGYPPAVGLGLAAAAISAFGVGASVVGVRAACSHFNPAYGPLGTVDGHSILPRQFPQARLSTGEQKSLMSGFVVNCGSQDVEVTAVEMVSQTGEAAQVVESSVLPVSRPGPPQGAGPDRSAVVPPTDDRASMAVFSRVKGVSPGFYSINGLRIRYRYRGDAGAQVFATNMAVMVSGGR